MCRRIIQICNISILGEEMRIDKKRIETVAKISVTLIGVTFAIMSVIAKKKRKKSLYGDQIEEKNLFEGQKVIFVSNEEEDMNADGVRGHLETIGKAEYIPSFYEKHLKRVIDVMLSFGGLVVLSPVFLFIAVLIYIEDPGPILFTQKRVGRNKQFFKLHKFRSMKMSTPKDVPTHMLENPEQYITKVGKFIREHSLDELPQIWDIFIGNMSVIGPRPALWNQDILIAERDKYNANDVKPGLTGWAQINGRDELEIPEKAKLDGEYVKKIGFFMDLKCFLGSIHVFGKDDSVVEGGTGELTKSEGAKADQDIKKRILVVCQYYKPEPFRISDICEEMVRRGHEVQVVTGYPNYPEGVLYDGYGRGKHIDEVINGVKIHRCFTIPRGQGAVKRFLNYYSYVMSSVKYILSSKCKASDGTSFDVVFCNQLSPVMMGEAAIAYKKKHKVPAVMYCLDLWPESLVAGGINRNSKIYKVFYYVSKHVYKNMDRILITSRMFSDYLNEQFGIEKGKIEYLPQYAEGIFELLPMKKQTDVFDFMFAGNIGEIQSVDTIIKAAEILKREPARFHIVGGGTDIQRLKDMSKDLDNVIFHGRRDVKEMPRFYKMADAMLITLKADEVLSLTLPGKVQSYMAVGKPIIGAIDGETRKVIEEAKCGYCGKAEDSEELARNIKMFMADADKGSKGLNARKYYEEHFEERRFMDLLEKELMRG